MAESRSGSAVLFSGTHHSRKFQADPRGSNFHSLEALMNCRKFIGTINKNVWEIRRDQCGGSAGK